MKIPNLNLLRKIRRPGAQIKPERTHYGIKFLLPESLTEDELLKVLVGIPADVYRLPENQGIAFDFAGRACSRRLILHMLQSIVWEKNLNVIAWLSGNQDSLKLFSSAGLCVNEPVQKIDIPEKDEPEPENLRPAGLKVMYTSMRSGQRIETDGDVLVWGHLNPGAEVKAGGSIIVAGRLLGVVHAGGFGREDVFVWAGSFETPQVRIGNKLCYADQRTTTCWRKGVLITLEDGTPVIREHKFFSAEKADKLTGGHKS
ncbi:MAG: hypothetical protein IJR85_04120 [Synergistaceae bacterium]|nr:hypothetical protein [Synergistaceae bacterium]